ncbi:MAG: hypothetical protein AAF529_04255 [Pseudomonadota bacterium]
MLRYVLAMLLCALLFVPMLPAYAEDADPFQGRLLPLELVMEFRRQIELTDKQNDAIGELVVALQRAVARRQWQMQSAYFDLKDALDAKQIDEEPTLQLVRQALQSENQIKVAQIGFLIKLRNLLDDKQIEFLRKQLDAGWKNPND